MGHRDLGRVERKPVADEVRHHVERLRVRRDAHQAVVDALRLVARSGAGGAAEEHDREGHERADRDARLVV